MNPYKKLKKAELLELVDARELDVDAGATKKDLIAALRADDEPADDGSGAELVIPEHDDVLDDDGNVIPEHGHSAAESAADRQTRLKART